jgi:hypothetical protein
VAKPTRPINETSTQYGHPAQGSPVWLAGTTAVVDVVLAELIATVNVELAAALAGGAQATVTLMPFTVVAIVIRPGVMATEPLAPAVMPLSVVGLEGTVRVAG